MALSYISIMEGNEVSETKFQSSGMSKRKEDVKMLEPFQDAGTFFPIPELQWKAN